jgi:hypothetical protein
MSATMRIRFQPDMPVSAVEVLGPDLEPVQRISIAPGSEASVSVPSEQSFIRIHLPSGRAVTMRPSGDLVYDIQRADLERTGSRKPPERWADAAKSVSGIRDYHLLRSSADEFFLGADKAPVRETTFGADGAEDRNQATLESGIGATWNPPVKGSLSPDRSELRFSPSGSQVPYQLRVSMGKQTLTARLPGNTRSAYLRADDISNTQRVVSLRVASESPTADTVGAYLARGDYYSAEAMMPWAKQAESLLQQKLADPYAATVSAYLLLRLERFDLMHNWPKNLADWFPELSDGCVIWASQLLAQKRDTQEAAEYLLKAVERGLPVYTEGLRLLTQQLYRMGDKGAAALKRINQEGGQPIWNSPFTARLQGSPEENAPMLSFDIGFAAEA